MVVRFFLFLTLIESIRIIVVIVRDITEIDNNKQVRTFTVDFNNNTFLKDGKPFSYVSGSFHYFRAHPDSWQRKLRTIRAAGLNAISTYVEWSLHNPKENVYIWDGIADIERFINLAAEEDLLVILRPGPYICAERDMGGFPYWLLRKYPAIKLRTADKNYLTEIRIWYIELMTRMEKYLYGNGGPIIMVQVENEYGSFSACDVKYREWLRDEIKDYVKENAVLFTTDLLDGQYLVCGIIAGVFTTVNFGFKNLKLDLNLFRKYFPHGPIVNSEFYSGWLTHWKDNTSTESTDIILPQYEYMLRYGVNVNFYMFFGGTNFGFTAGANFNTREGYKADVTSYDYDAPMNEAGDPTLKYYQIREVTKKYFQIPNITIPTQIPKKNYGIVPLVKCCSLLSKEGRKYVSTGTINSDVLQTFEYLEQNSGFVLYETNLPQMIVPNILKIFDIRDRAYIYVDHQFVGILSRDRELLLPITFSFDSKLEILVESQGRINYGIVNDFKGILSDVIVGETVLSNWTITKYPLDNYNNIEQLINKQRNHLRIHETNAVLHSGPTIFYGDFQIKDNDIGDTYLNPTGWSKGLVFINGFNLGRYWPIVGPQVTLFVPKEILHSGINLVVLIEYERALEEASITLTNVPILNGYIQV